VPGIERANQIGGDEQKRKDALNFAAEGLWNMRLYSRAADLLTASLPDVANSKALIGKIQLFRNLKPYKGGDLPATDPRSPVQRLVVGGIRGTLTDAVIAQCVSRHPFLSDAEWKRDLSNFNVVADKFRAVSKQTGLPQIVIQDLALGSMKLTSVPSDEAGTRVVLELPGVVPQNFFVSNEDGSYKVVATDRSLGEVGNEALYLLHHNREAEATALLNWKRDLLQKGQDDDDPLGGLLFARLWSIGKSMGPQAIRFAAASLSTDQPMVLPLLPEMIAARNTATTRVERDNIDLLLASIYLRAENASQARLISQRLLDRYSDSATAVALRGRAYGLTKDWLAWRSLLNNRIQRHPGDRLFLLQSAAEAEAEGDFPRARHAFRSIIDTGHALADDYNMYAWLSLFGEGVDDQALAAAQQANLLSKNSNSAYLHTLACLDAERGEAAEARQLLLEAMSSSNLEEPNSAIWYAFGRIYEQYGVYDAASNAYKRVERPENIYDPTDSFWLAQARLKTLGTNKLPLPESHSSGQY
jgi:tetratricopeptide (TPR) repeat protein